MSEDEKDVIKIDAMPMGKGSRLKKKEFTNPALRREIIKLRQDGTSWEKISKDIQAEFNCSISPMTARSIYDDEIARAVVVSPKAKQSYSKYNSLIEENYSKLQDLMNWWINTLNQIKDDIIVENIMVSPAEFVKFLKVTESIEKGNRSILEQIKFIKSETDRVNEETKKHIFSPQQINQKIAEFRKAETESMKLEREKIAKERKELEKEKELFRTKRAAMIA